MARRASSSTHPVWMLIGVALVVGALTGGYFLYGRVSDPYRTMRNLPVQDYLENSNSLRGNVYKLDGTISQSLDWSPTAGRLFAVDGLNGEVLPILIPAQFNHVNLERGQRYFFKIEVGDKGILRAQDVKKV
ncbi:MAG: hypothetical protein M3463_21620 [Verrucomicrobiota bacterium]|nr:hypothetical protein [Verrucomicrobiota bacterium]